jgi:protease-4
MRSFFASFFGTLAALAMLAAAMTIGSFMLLSGLSAKTETLPTVQKGSWLVLDLSDGLQDAPLQNDGLENVARLFGNDEDARVLQARQATRAIQAAASDPDIAGLYLSGQEPALADDAGFATLAELRDAILAFRGAGKPVKAWLTYAGTRDYYLASAADDVVIDPFGAILVPGLATQPMFFTGAFEKLGIGVQITRVGKYKSAVEPFTRSEMSTESRAQTQKLLDDIWRELVRSMESTRNLPAGTLQQAADSEGLVRAEAAARLRLVDRVAYLDQVLEELRDATDAKGKKESFRQIQISEYSKLVSRSNLVAKRGGAGTGAVAPSGHEKIAIVYTEGAIVDGSGNDNGVVWGDKVARQLRELRRDDSVRAVVLRVNSPGGSVTASETIQREVRLLQPSKPVVISMGSVAASGGYWISTYSDRIFAEPTTITGSIGVFGLLFNVETLANERLGLTFDTVKTGRFADAATVTRPKTPEELEIVQRHVDWIYDQFLSKVSESRRIERAQVQEIAQGRVWSGAEATRLGLVDEIGGLDAAIAWAANKANIGEEFAVVEYPPRKRFLEAITEALGEKKPEKASDAIVAFVHETVGRIAALSEYNDPRGVYARLPFDFALR